MPNPTTHVLLVSAQAAPNLLPALDPELKPRSAVLLVTAAMKRRADALESVLREAAVCVTRVTIADEGDVGALEDALLGVAAEQEALGGDVALNVTGGTKLMALTAQSIARAARWRVFYVDVDTDEVIWLDESKAPRHKLAASLRLRHYLQGYGFRLDDGIARPPTNRRHDDLLRTLIGQVGSLEAPLGQLNYLAQVAEDARSLNVELSLDQQDSRSLEALLRNFASADVLAVSGNTLRFASEDERGLAKGGWLEQHVYRTISGLTGELAVRDKAANLVVTDDDGVRNELDVAFMARNRLFIVECKTARMDDPRRPGKANDTLFKLAGIARRVGGLGTRGLLASYRRLGDAEKKLARALGIEIVAGADLSSLDERLKRWVRG